MRGSGSESIEIVEERIGCFISKFWSKAMSETNRKTEWNQNFELVKTFAANNSRWPSTTSKEESEKALGQWWSRQKYLLGKNTDGNKTPGISPEREVILKEFIQNNAHLERDGVWEDRYNKVVAKFKADGKLWPYATTDAEELKSIRWWNQQKTFARKFKAEPDKSYGGMTQERYSKIVALMRVMGQDLEASTETVPVADSTTQS